MGKGQAPRAIRITTETSSRVYPSVAAAIAATGYAPSSIYRRLNGLALASRCKGWTAEYVDGGLPYHFTPRHHALALLPNMELMAVGRTGNHLFADVGEAAAFLRTTPSAVAEAFNKGSEINGYTVDTPNDYWK